MMTQRPSVHGTPSQQSLLVVLNAGTPAPAPGMNAGLGTQGSPQQSTLVAQA
jgi:hypothetical protein